MKRSRPTPAELTACLETVRDRYSASLPGGILQIGDGSCEEVVADVVRILGFPESSVFFSAETFSFVDDEVFDVELIIENWPATVPPPGLSWDDLDNLGMADTAHAWLVLDGRHYDADVPHGVDSFLDLPIFRRNLANAMREEKPAEFAELSARHHWWAESDRLGAEFAAAAPSWRHRRAAAFP